MVTSVPLTYNSTQISWTVADFSHATSQCAPWAADDLGGNSACINITQHFFLAGVLFSKTTDLSLRTYDFEGMPTPKQAYQCQVAVALSCPDHTTYLDAAEYSAGSLPAYDHANTQLSYESGNSSTLQGVTCYTRPQPVTITEVARGSSNPDTELRVQFTQPDSGVSYIVKMERDITDFTHLSAATVIKEDTVNNVLFPGMSRGQPQQVTVQANWIVDPSLNITSLIAPTAFINTDPATILTLNGQTNLGDPVYGCTDPGEARNFMAFGVNNNTVAATWLAPDGVSNGVNFTLTKDGVQIFNFVIDRFPTASTSTADRYEYPGLGPCVLVTVGLRVRAGCGTTLGDLWSASELTDTAYTTPYTPFWLPDLAVINSASSIYLAWNDTNGAACAGGIFTVIRDNVNITDVPGNKFHTDTSNLIAGTVYSYQVTISVFGETSPKSPRMSICTKPDPPANGRMASSTDTTMTLNWDPPAAGAATGYLLSDDRGNAATRLETTGFQYVGLLAGTEYTVAMSVLSYLECSITGVAQVQELQSATPYAASVTGCTTPDTPVLTETGSNTVQIQMLNGSVSVFRIQVSQSVSQPTSAEGTVTGTGTSFNLTVASPGPSGIYSVAFAGVTASALFDVQVTAEFACSTGDTLLSLPSSIAFKTTKDDKLIGMHPALAAIVIVVIAVVVLGAIAVVVAVVIYLVTHMSAAPAAGPAAEPADPQNRSNLANDLRDQFIAGQLANNAP